MSVHTAYKKAKPGLMDRQIIAAKALRSIVNVPLVKSWDSLDEVSKALVSEHQVSQCILQTALHRRFSDHGDFTNCYRGGFY